MSFDSSRVTFDAWKDFLGVVMQQGRVQLDADWNELVAQLVRRIQTGAFDTFETPVVPKTTPDGFLIKNIGSGGLTIGRGRMYVDGLLAENHGDPATKTWDPHLAELIGGAAINFAAQPYLPPGPSGAIIPTGPGPHLIYLDVWRREITHLTHPELIETAVGVDTTGRYQTIWQVKILDNVGGGVSCSTPDAEINKWSNLIRPSAARLSTSTGGPAAPEDPCQVPPTGGYKGRENQLYRVEIHQGGATATATFKWSRDNASVQSRVMKIEGAGTSVVVDSLGRDEVLSFHEGDWVEITDDYLELQGLPGVMARISTNGVNSAARSITFSPALNAATFPVNLAGEPTASRHTRIRRWNHRGRVLREDGTLYHDLDGSTGVIPVPPAGTKLILEDGILVNFELDPSGGEFRAGDHWSFAARTAEASIEELDRAPPLGVHHHYARLATMTPAGVVTSCRTFWPPDIPEGGEDCACDACVTPEGHAAGATIQKAIDQVMIAGGGVICLRAGKYILEKPLKITGNAPLRIQGRGWRTLLISQDKLGRALEIEKSLGLVLENFTVIGAAVDQQGTLISARNTVGLELDHLYALTFGNEGNALGLTGHALKTRLRECAIVGATAAFAGGVKDPCLLFDLQISDSFFFCSRAAIAIGQNTISLAHNSIARNVIFQRDELKQGEAIAGGIIAIGGALRESSLSIEANTIHVRGPGVVAGLPGLKILDNEVHAVAVGNHSGIVIDGGLNPEGVDHLWICGNHISRFGRAGIEARIPVRTAMIKQNIIRNTNAGIVFPLNAPSEQVAIENNQLLELGSVFDEKNAMIAGIQVFASGSVDISGNVVRDFAEKAVIAPVRAAIQVVASRDVRVAANRLNQIGPREKYLGYGAGIDLVTAYSQCAVSDNIIRRASEEGLEIEEPSAWFAIRARAGFAKGPDPIKVLLSEHPEVILRPKVFGLIFLAELDHLSARGNQLTSSSPKSEVVLFEGLGSCIFAENYVRAGTSRFAAVNISSKTAIVSNNRIEGGDPDVSMKLQVGAVGALPKATVVGNITSRPIFLNAQSVGGQNGGFNITL